MPLLSMHSSIRPFWVQRVLLLAAVLLVGAAPQQLADRSPKPLRIDQTASGPVYIVPIEGLVDNALAAYLERALADAEADDATLIVLHVDTFGGLLDAADRMRKALLNVPVPTVAFIDRNAASAGALISYAADRIVMVPGASIGAATVVEGGSGEAAPDKYQSYMRGLMRATAEANERDPRIAEAMVDETIDIEGVSASGKVLTLTSDEALELGVADAVLPSVEAVVEAYGLSSAIVVRHQASRTEKVLRFFASPVIQSLLMLMMLGGLYFELQSPGVGFAGAMALVGAAAFFAPHYLLGLVESWELIVFVLGIVLIVLELFVIPGFGIAGISGVALVLFGLGVSLIGNVGFDFPSFQQTASALSTLAVTLVLLVLLSISLARYLPRSERFSELVLVPDLSSATGYTSADTDSSLLGQTGQTVTPLRPSGWIEVDGRRVDVVTAEGFIDAGEAVEVVQVRGSRVEVRRRRVNSASDETSIA